MGQQKDSTPVYIGVALVVMCLMRGEVVTTKLAGELMDRTRSTAYRVLTTLESCHKIPIYYDKIAGGWRLMNHVIVKREENPCQEINIE